MTAVEFFYDVSSPWLSSASRRPIKWNSSGNRFSWAVYSTKSIRVYERRENPVPPKQPRRTCGIGATGIDSVFPQTERSSPIAMRGCGCAGRNRGGEQKDGATIDAQVAADRG